MNRFLELYGATLLLLILVFVAVNGDGPPQIRGLEYLGSADGKHYFLDEDTSVQMSWMMAEEYCNKTGMRLASISSENQSNLLGSALHGRGWEYWTSGRENRSPKGIVWDWADPETTLNDELFEYVDYHGYYTIPYFCLLIGPLSENGLRIVLAQCSRECRPLCETV